MIYRKNREEVILDLGVLSADRVLLSVVWCFEFRKNYVFGKSVNPFHPVLLETNPTPLALTAGVCLWWCVEVQGVSASYVLLIAFFPLKICVLNPFVLNMMIIYNCEWRFIIPRAHLKVQSKPHQLPRDSLQIAVKHNKCSTPLLSVPEAVFVAYHYPLTQRPFPIKTGHSEA